MSNNCCFIISTIGTKGTEIREQADAVLQYIIRPALIQMENDGGPAIVAVLSDDEEQMVAEIHYAEMKQQLKR